jgi:hypothetical protein
MNRRPPPARFGGPGLRSAGEVGGVPTIRLHDQRPAHASHLLSRSSSRRSNASSSAPVARPVRWPPIVAMATPASKTACAISASATRRFPPRANERPASSDRVTTSVPRVRAMAHRQRGTNQLRKTRPRPQPHPLHRHRRRPRLVRPRRLQPQPQQDRSPHRCQLTGRHTPPRPLDRRSQPSIADKRDPSPPASSGRSSLA